MRAVGGCSAGAAREARAAAGRAAVSGAAPIAPQVLEFFWALGVPRARGLRADREHRGLHVHAGRTTSASATVGKALARRRAADRRRRRDPHPLARGRSSATSATTQATAETIDADGWLHTGDVGELDADGFLTITDRKKDIIITAGGKNISPSEIENKLKVSPYVREAIVIGDQRKYLTALDRHRARHRRRLGDAPRPAVHDLRRPVLARPRCAS